MTIVMVLMSATQLATGFFDSFLIFVAMNVLHGAMSSFVNPLVYTIATDYFPPERRGFANSIIAASSKIGLSLSSLSLIIIKNFGWRNAYYVMGSLALFIGAICQLTIKDKRR